MGLHLQASCLISFFFSVIISILWFYTEPIFIFLHQDPQISKAAALYLKHLIPGLFAYGFVQNILKFLQTQSIVLPLVWFSILPMGLHFGIVYTFVNQTSLGTFQGNFIACFDFIMDIIHFVDNVCRFYQEIEGYMGRIVV